jgi:hypothetical protein
VFLPHKERRAWEEKNEKYRRRRRKKIMLSRDIDNILSKTKNKVI